MKFGTGRTELESLATETDGRGVIVDIMAERWDSGTPDRITNACKADRVPSSNPWSELVSLNKSVLSAL